MADGSISFNKGYEYVIYSHNGKTMIGKFYSTSPIEQLPDGGVHKTFELAGDSGYFWVANPAEIVFNLSVPAAGSAKLEWHINPLFYHDMISSTETLYKNVIVSYPKSQIAITNIGGTIIDETLLNAYKEISE